MFDYLCVCEGETEKSVHWQAYEQCDQILRLCVLYLANSTAKICSKTDIFANIGLILAKNKP